MTGQLIKLAIAFLALAWIYLLLIKPKKAKKVFEIPFGYYAHRGLHDMSIGIPENSMAAFKRAMERNFGIELDVRFTKDRQVVVFHDDNLKRLCGVDKRVEDLMLSELKEYKILDTEERIPLLSEVLKLVDGRVPMLIELKADNVPATKPLCEQVAKVTDGYHGPYVVQSFNPLAVRWFAKNRKQIPRGILSGNIISQRVIYGFVKSFFATHLLTNFFIKPNFVSYEWQYSSKLSFTICRKVFRGVCACWTIKDEETLGQLKRANRCSIFIFEGFIPDSRDAHFYGSDFEKIGESRLMKEYKN